MIRNHFKIALRVFTRNPSYALINILGMASGLAIAMLILLYVRFELNYESQNPIADRVVRISMDYLDGETVTDQDAEMYHPVGPRITSELSEVADFARAYPISEATIKAGDLSYRESRIYAVDPAFFSLLHHPLLYGNPDSLFTSPDELVLTESQSLKYFQRSNVVGELLQLSGFDRPFKITGVVADNPLNTHFKFNLLISYATVRSIETTHAWSNNSTYTYLLLSEDVRYDRFLSNLEAFNERLYAEKLLQHEKIIAQPIKDIHLYSHKSFEAEQNGDAASVYFLLGVAILVLLVAAVNYINLSTARSLDRAKEVGIRKVIGSTLAQLRVQFFTESFLINFASAFVALAAMWVALPTFRHLAGLPEGFHLWNDPWFWSLLLGIVSATAILSGMFPAIILSSFKPVSVLKGKFSRSARGAFLRKSLVVFQFSITLFLLIQTFTAERQLAFMRDQELGLEAEHTVVVRSPNEELQRDQFKAFKSKLQSETAFRSVTLSSSVPGQPSREMSTSTGINLVDALEQRYFNFYVYFVDEDFVPVMEMEMVAGQNFVEGMNAINKVVVNEESVKLWGIPDAAGAVGKSIDMWGEHRQIIGVVKNFHQGSLKMPFAPMIFVADSPWSNRLASIRIPAGDITSNLDKIKSVYASVFPDSPFEYFFLDEEFDKQYRAEEQFKNVFGTLTGFAILIACLGLFGLVSFTVANRTKEIGIRKVLGASLYQIMGLLSKDFVMLILVAMSVSISLTYFAVERWLEGYAFRIEMHAWLFVAPALGVLGAALAVIWFKTFRVSTANPVDALKEE